MSVVWASWAEFFAMGGYGLYVWGSVAAVALVVVGEVLVERQRLRTALQWAGRDVGPRS